MARAGIWMRHIKVSTVILTKNSERTLNHCLSALRKALSSIGSYEVIIVDGYSRDGTLNIVSKYIPNAHILQHEGNLAQCRKVGIQTSQGEYICMIDSDIVVPSNFFDMMRFFDDDVGCVTGIFDLVGDSFVKEYYEHERERLQLKKIGVIETDESVAAACTIYRACLLKRSLPDERLFAGEDKDMALGIIDLGYKILIDTDMVCVHTRESSLTDEMRRNFIFGEIAHILFDRHPDYKRKMWKRRCLSLFASLVFPFYYFLKVRKFKYAFAAWLLALSYNLGFLSSRISPSRRY
jgi:glycosyltransferase involved in cell wall biosynthesis